METKSKLVSKTFWVNVIAIGVIVYQMATGTQVVIDPETQTLILAVINFILRFVTKQPINWK